MRFWLAIIALLLVWPAQAQTRQPASITTTPVANPALVPQNFFALDATGAWVKFLTSNVQGSGYPGLQEGKWFILNTVTDPATEGLGPVRIDKITNYSGGTIGNSPGTLAVYNYVNNSGTATSQTSVLAVTQNSSTQALPAAQNTGAFLNGWCMVAGCSATWGADIVAWDQSKQSNPTKPLVGLEVDVEANGTDANNVRAGLVVVGLTSAGGSTATINKGISIGDNNDGTKFNSAFQIEAHSVVQEINLEAATATYGIYVGGAITNSTLLDTTSSPNVINVGGTHSVALSTNDAAIKTWATGGRAIVLGSETSAANSNSQTFEFGYRDSGNVKRALDLIAVASLPGGRAALQISDTTLANAIALAPSVTGGAATIVATGSDASVSIAVAPKGTGSFAPNIDNTTPLGDATHRWASVNAISYLAGASGQVGVSCTVGTVSAATMIITNGIVTHC